MSDITRWVDLAQTGHNWTRRDVETSSADFILSVIHELASALNDATIETRALQADVSGLIQERDEADAHSRKMFIAVTDAAREMHGRLNQAEVDLA